MAHSTRLRCLLHDRTYCMIGVSGLIFKGNITCWFRPSLLFILLNHCSSTNRSVPLFNTGTVVGKKIDSAGGKSRKAVLDG